MYPDRDPVTEGHTAPTRSDKRSGYCPVRSEAGFVCYSYVRQPHRRWEIGGKAIRNQDSLLRSDGSEFRPSRRCRRVSHRRVVRSRRHASAGLARLAVDLSFGSEVEVATSADVTLDAPVAASRLNVEA